MSKRTGSLSFIGHPMRLCLFFAANRAARLTSSEVAELLGIQARGVAATMDGALKAGLLGRVIGGGKTQTIYFAGPTLLDALALQRPDEDDFAVTQVIRPPGSWERPRGAPATWLGAVA